MLETHDRRSRIAVAVAALGCLALAGAGHAEWSLRYEAVHMEIHGLDRHVLNVQRLDTANAVSDNAALLLDTKTNFSYRGEFRQMRREWGWGVDFLWVRAPQAGARSDSGSAANPVSFEIAERTYSSADAGRRLFYDVLEDTTVESWTLDVYALKTLGETADGSLRLQLGLRNADFDNDYRAVVGVLDTAGTRIDTSSNYSRLMGPLVGLIGEVRRGKSVFEGYLGQSVVLGEVALFGMSRDFTGTFTEATDPAYFAQRGINANNDVAIPITEARLRWTRRLTRRFSASLGTMASLWHQVPIPPGVAPGIGGSQSFDESTLLFFGAHAGIRAGFGNTVRGGG